MSAETDPRGGWTSASGAEADMLCPGRHLAQRGLVSQSTEDAAIGLRIHAAMASGDLSKLDLRERETYDACREIEAKLIEQFFSAQLASQVKTFRHQRYWIEIHSNNPDGSDRWLKHSGELDVCHRLGERALIVDFKTLMGHHEESPRNLQLRDYAVLARNEFVFIKEIGVAIVQPWVTHSPEICLYSESDLKLAESQLLLRVAASNNPRSKRVPGDVQCQFCLAAKHGKCIEYQQWAGQVTPAAMLALLEVPVASWTPEQRSRAMDALRPARQLLDAIEDTVKVGLQNDPGFCPGWKLKPGNKREIVDNPQKVYERFVALGGKNEDFMDAVDIRKGALRAALNATTGARGVALDKALAVLTQGCVDVKQNAPSLERTDDAKA